MRVIETSEQMSGGAGNSQDAIDARSGESFDRHVLGRIFLHTAAEADRLGDTIADRLGVDAEGFAALAQYLTDMLKINPPPK